MRHNSQVRATLVRADPHLLLLWPMSMEAEQVRKHIVIRKSRPGLGHGLFARTPLRKGDLIAEYTGKRISTAHADTLKTRYLFEIDKEWTIDGSSRDNVARYINHSCEPNCECEEYHGRVFVYTMRNIRKGEEFTIDYGEEYFDEFIRPIGCRCMHCAE